MAKRRHSVTTSVFLDSSVIFTAVNSPTGGSAKLFTLKKVRLVTSPTVLTEVERNVRKKLLSYHLQRFFMLVEKLTIISQRPNDTLIAKAKKVIVEKDAVILAEARQTRADFLVTLDIKHFFTPQAARFLNPQKILTPKMMITTIKF